MTKNQLSPLLLALTLSGCASAPPAPTIAMRPVQSYSYLNCDQLNLELGAVSTWEQHHAEMNTYMQSQASFMQSMDSVTAILTAVGSSADPTMASIYQQNSQASSLATAQTENAQAQAAAHQAGLVKRRATLEQLRAIKQC
jgi:hypothetical protein